MSLAKVFPFLVVVFWTSAPAESIDPTCISNLVRPSNSHIELQLPELNVPLPEYGDVVDSMLTRHHIIPRSTLLPFFLGALTNENWRPRFVQFLRSLSSAHYSPSDDEVLNGVETHLPVDRNAELGALRALWLRFCWMPFNFFMGPMPHYRSDDPGEAWEGNTEPIVGDRIFEKMHSLITSMNMMISDDHRHIDQKTDDFNDAMKLLEMLHETITNPYEFERQHWIETPGETMKYHIQTINDSADRNYLRRRRSTYSSDIMSVVAADPYCLETDHTIAEALRNSTFWLNLKTDTLYDLEAVNLLTTQQTIAAVSIVESKFDFATWKDWYRTLNDTCESLFENFKSADSIEFHDGSFAVLTQSSYYRQYTHDTTWLVTKWWHMSQRAPNAEAPVGVLVFDSMGRPILIRMHEESEAVSLHKYERERWAWADDRKWETIFRASTNSLDLTSPQFQFKSTVTVL